MEMTREQAEKCTILRTLVGSTVHGVNVEDGLEDRDEMGIVLEPVEFFVTTDKPFEQYIYRSAAEREGKPDAKSRAGDLDLTLYSLRKFVKLALQGNPTVMLPLWAPILKADARGTSLRAMRREFASRQAGERFLGFLQAQKQRLLGEQGGKDVNRPELVEKFGFDTKYALHMLRLGHQGVEFLETGELTLPMNEPIRSWLRGVRTGQVPLAECISVTEQLESKLRYLIDGGSPLPETPNYAAVNDWMQYMYLNNWKSANPFFQRQIPNNWSNEPNVFVRAYQAGFRA